MPKFKKKLFLLFFFCITTYGYVDLKIYPIHIDLPIKKPISAITLENLGDTPSLLQIEVMRWQQHQGKDILTPTHDLMVMPLIFTLAGKESQIVRIAMRHPPPNKNSEATYRIIIKEVPSKYIQKINNGVITLMNFSLPVFISPSEKIGDWNWQIKKINPQELQLTLINPTNMHAKLSQIILQVPESTKAIYQKMLSSYILPEQQKNFTIKLDQPLHTSIILLTAQTNSGKITQQFSLY
jgi:fimbrial chaperone protein